MTPIENPSKKGLNPNPVDSQETEPIDQGNEIILFVDDEIASNRRFGRVRVTLLAP